MEEFDDVEYGLPDILIPAELLACKTISWTERALFGYIRNLCYSPKGCYASNAHLAKMLFCTVSTVSHGISHLTDAGFIDCDYQYVNKNLTKRFITIALGMYDKKNLQRKEHKTKSQMQKVTMGQMQKVASLISIVEPISKVEDLKSLKETPECKTPSGELALKSSTNKDFSLFHYLKKQYSTDSEQLISKFLFEYDNTMQNFHPEITTLTLQKYIDILDGVWLETFNPTDDMIENMIFHFFNGKVFQKTNFKLPLFVSNVHKFMERYPSIESERLEHLSRSERENRNDLYQT